MGSEVALIFAVPVIASRNRKPFAYGVHILEVDSAYCVGWKSEEPMLVRKLRLRLEMCGYTCGVRLQWYWMGACVAIIDAKCLKHYRIAHMMGFVDK